MPSTAAPPTSESDQHRTSLFRAGIPHRDANVVAVPLIAQSDARFLASDRWEKEPAKCRRDPADCLRAALRAQRHDRANESDE